jgi:hypothetical protein
MSHKLENYRLQNVYLRTSAAQRAQLAAFWLREGAIADPWEAERRAHEAAFLVWRNDDELAGLSTVRLHCMHDGRWVYAYRMFLRERDRMPYLMNLVIATTRDFLRDFKHPDAQPVGMLHVNENPKLMRPGIRKLFERHGYRYLGQNRKGQDLWLTEFAQDKLP